MIELYQLRQFMAFADSGTLSEAAHILHLSQPALSRNMKKLEEDLGVSLFERTKNKLTLNENGIYVRSLVKKLLENADSLPVKAQEFDRKNRTITIGICSPAPMWTLSPLLTDLFPFMSIQTEQDIESRLISRLDNDIDQLIVLHEKPDDELYISKKCSSESLMFSLPKGHKYAKRKSLTFSEMNGENMLLMPDIGFWSFVKEKMPDSNFLVQEDRFSFNQLLIASSLPSFITDLSQKYHETASGRICVPISDKEAFVTYYLVCKKEHEYLYKSLFGIL